MNSQERWFQGRLKYAMQTVLTTLHATKDQPTRSFAVKTALEVCHEIVPRSDKLTPLHRAMLHGLIATIGYLERHSPVLHANEAIKICDRIVKGELMGDAMHAHKLSVEMGKILVLLGNEERDLRESKRVQRQWERQIAKARGEIVDESEGEEEKEDGGDDETDSSHVDHAGDDVIDDDATGGAASADGDDAVDVGGAGGAGKAGDTGDLNAGLLVPGTATTSDSTGMATGLGTS